MCSWQIQQVADSQFTERQHRVRYDNNNPLVLPNLRPGLHTGNVFWAISILYEIQKQQAIYAWLRVPHHSTE